MKKIQAETTQDIEAKVCLEQAILIKSYAFLVSGIEFFSFTVIFILVWNTENRSVSLIFQLLILVLG